MIGHGRPSLSPIARARDAPFSLRTFARHLCAITSPIALLLCAMLGSAANAQDAPGVAPLRLRISWGGASPTMWTGRAWLDDGLLTELKLLGTAADRAGSIWLQDRQVRINSLSPRTLDVIEVTASATSSAQLLVALTPASSFGGNTPAPVKVPLADVLRRSVAVRLDEHGNTLRVERVPPESLEIVTDRKALIFAPGEQFSFELRPQLSDMAPGTSLDIEASLALSGRNEPIWSAPQRFEVPIEDPPLATVTVPIPQAEGVYTIRITATRSPGFRARFLPGGAGPTAERSFDIVVLDARPQQAAGPVAWETVLEIDPTSPRWWERLPRWTQLRRLPAMNFRHVGSTRASTIDLPYGRFVELPPTTAGADPHWQAYSLPVEAVGVPHLLELDYPAASDQHFGLSIVEPNAAGIVEGVGRDGGVYVEGFGQENAKQTHRMLFWPRTQSPMLLVTNQHPSAAAMFGQIRVLKYGAPHLSSASVARSPADRMVAAYIARPFLAESFGAANAVGKPVGFTASEAKTIDDWQTIYDSATRLSESVRYGGYNSAVVSVLADGSAIYPSAHLPETSRYNSGRAARDFPDRDGLELLLRVFDRDGLAFVPALQLAAPLPELEAVRRGSDPQTSGLEWVGPDGRTWIEVNGTQQGLAPYYNLLDPRVQQAMLNVVGELVGHYGRHASFAGMSIQLSANSYAQLPPLEWGLDDATIARFERETGIHLSADGPDRIAARHALLTREFAEAWRKWRIEQVTQFYARIVSILRENASRGNRRLILTLEDSFAHPNLAARVRPNILLANRVDGALLDAGIDRIRLQATPGIVVCATRYVESMAPLAKRAIDFELNEAFAAWRKSPEKNEAAAALHYHRPQRLQLASFQPQNTWKIKGGIELVTQSTAHAGAVRQPYVRTLLQHDPIVLLDGGELLPLGQDDTLREAREILRQLPVEADVAEVVQQPVTVRTYAAADGVTLLVVNGSPWETTADIKLDVPRTAVMKPLGAADDAQLNQPRALAAGRQSWPLTLEPYAIRAVRIESPDVRVLDVVAKPNQAARAELAARLMDFQQRNLTAPRSYNVLRNPSFELLSGATSISGWRSTNAAATVELDDSNARHGATSVHFRNQSGAAALESDAFPMPPTGQLAMTVFVRGQRMAPGGELRVVIESIDGGHRYRRSQPVRPLDPDADANQWKVQPILVNDLPLELPGNICVRFEMTGPGEVWLDAVTLYDLLFPLKWYKHEDNELLEIAILKFAAKSALDEGRIVDCARVLEKYWPRFVTEYTPAVQVAARPVPNRQQPLSPQPNQNEQPAPGIRESIKRVLPSFK
jgi:hypothetical protein